MSIDSKPLHGACCRALRTALATSTALLGILPKPRLAIAPAAHVLAGAHPCLTCHRYRMEAGTSIAGGR